MSLRLRPVEFKEACAFVARVHRHHDAPVGHKFSVGVEDEGGVLRGVAIIGRPVARRLDDGFTLEVTRLATDGARMACSTLYAAAARAARALGYRRILTFTLASESGASVRAAGWTLDGTTPGRSWSVPSRPRGGVDLFGDPLTRDTTGPKTRWVRILSET